MFKSVAVKYKQIDNVVKSLAELEQHIQETQEAIAEHKFTEVDDKICKMQEYHSKVAEEWRKAVIASTN